MTDQSPVCECLDGKVIFHCPGCDDVHWVNVDPAKGRPCWQYNGNPQNPTFSPSILVMDHWSDGKTICHSFVRDGNIEFLNDCAHALAGKTVPLQAWPYAPGAFGGVKE